MPRMNTPGVFSCLSILLPQAFFDDKANHHLNTPKFYFFVVDEKGVHTNPHAGAAPAQIGMKTGRRKIARFLIQ